MANKVNYQKELDSIIGKLGDRVPRLFLHVCCAPCSSYCLEYLSRYFEITVFFYNPNISPEREYRFRASEEQRFISEIQPVHPIHYVEGTYLPSEWFEEVRGLEKEPEGGERCTVCFRMRLREAARLAKEGGFDWFTTTLTISPLKDAARLNAIGQAAGEEFGVKWLPSDFKKKEGYTRSIQLSREHNLYRQDYCGCAFSREESERRRQEQEKS